ncbi:hypothetical protein PPYR_08574 [Photinus pyralis]|uniref:Protein takeout n=1 Tax=Photinus pyralis TaxID=7054 RepID=A0A5N4AJS5_PHOPY|nr:protein takeout-like [Photinus pyralis]KAB0797581.1 hypothetical protein PPYR_08574 [Photinus pyralis]
MRSIALTAVIFVIATSANEESVTLPSFLRVCHQSDPKLNECIKEAVQKIKPLLADGLPEFDIPSLEPLHISEILIDHGAGALALKSTYTDIKVYGPSQFVLKSVKIDLKKDRVRLKLWLPHLRVVSQYSMNGRMLMMPISGKGESCGNYSNIDVTVTLQGQRITKHGDVYFNIKDFYVDFVLGHATIKLENLFNGDKHLGDTMNSFLNDNWQNVAKEIKPVLEDNVAKIFKKMANRIFSKYPLNVILPD